jgi:hypothetical protein
VNIIQKRIKMGRYLNTNLNPTKDYKSNDNFQCYFKIGESDGVKFLCNRKQAERIKDKIYEVLSNE